MFVLGRRSDGALHLAMGGGVSVILRGGVASPPSDEAVVTRLGPWYSATPFDLPVRRQIEGILARARIVPLVALGVQDTVRRAEDGFWSCPSCGYENAVRPALGCEHCGPGRRVVHRVDRVRQRVR